MANNDRNAYPTVKIGNQVWMAANLKTTKYRNGDVIEKVTEKTKWAKLSTGCYCAYDNNEENAETYGYLYNWWAVTDSRNIAPEGWHVPTDSDWTQLTSYLGGKSVAGGKLKSTLGWNSPNIGATNESKFSALPGGYRSSDGNFDSLMYYANFWFASESGSTNAWNRSLYFSYADANWDYDNKKCGFSVRLIKD